MRYTLTLALLFTCLSAAWAADDPVTKQNNDASTPALIKSPPMQPIPWSEIEKTRAQRKDSGPTR